jgi:hypothetical protein
MAAHRRRKRAETRKQVAPTTWREWLRQERSDAELLCTDADLTDPERVGLVVKLHLASYVATREPGRSKLQAWAQRIARGPLTLVPNLHDWALEEFLYHGAPGDDWQPLEAYLAFVGSHLSEAGQAKLRQWRQAELGAYRIGAVQGQTVRLQRWDVVRDAPLGEEFAARSWAFGGAEQTHRGHENQVLIMYVAPWESDPPLAYALGYSVVRPRQGLDLVYLVLAPNFFTEAGKPFPWPPGVDREEQLREWRTREWLGWLAERLRFPFLAFVPFPPRGQWRLTTVVGLAPLTPEQARHFGVYVEVPRPHRQEVVIAGLTSVIPFEVGLPVWDAVIEYHAFRHVAGPPPGLPR